MSSNSSSWFPSFFPFFSTPSGSNNIPDSEPKRESLDERLCALESAQERMKIYQQEAEDLLGQELTFPAIKRDQFIQMHMPLMSIHGELEGSHSMDSVDLWLAFIQATRVHHFSPISHDISEETLGTLEKKLKDFKKFDEVVHLPNLTLEERALTLKQKLIYTLKEKRAAYVPFGYREGKFNSGHSIPCYFELTSTGTVMAYLLNKGEGAHLHPPLDFTETQDKLCMRFFPIEIEWKTFCGEMGTSFFEYALRMLTEPIPYSRKPYEAQELIEALNLLGKAQAYPQENFKDWEGKVQLGPSCAEKGVKNVVHDTLKRLSSPAKDNRRFFLNAALYSLIAAYQTFDRTQESALLLLENAVSSVSIRIEKEFSGLLTNEECIKVCCLLDRVKTEIDSSLNAATKKVVPSQLSPPAKVPCFYPQSIKAIRIPRYAGVKEEFSASYANELYNKELFTYYNQVVKQSIHRPSETLTDPKKIREDLCESFKIVKKLISKSFPYENRFKKFLVVFAYYARMDQLIRRLDNCQLKGEAFFAPFWPDYNKKVHLQIDYIPQAVDQQLFSEIKHYFSSVKSEEALPLFFHAIDPLKGLDLYKKVSSLKSEKKKGWKAPQAIHHLQFLSQFIPDDVSKKKELSLYRKLWTQGEAAGSPSLPTELEQFRWVSAAAYSLSNLSSKPSLESVNRLSRPIESTNIRHSKRLFEVTEYYALYQLIFSKNGSAHNITENQASLFRLQGSSADDASFMRFYLRFRKNPQLFIPAFLQYLEDHKSSLAMKEYHWSLVKGSFFQLGALIETFTEHSDLIHQTRALFFERIQLSLEKRNGLDKALPLFAFLIQVEAYIKQVQGEEWSSETLNQCRQLLPHTQMEQKERNQSSWTPSHLKIISYSIQEKFSEIEATECLYLLLATELSDADEKNLPDYSYALYRLTRQLDSLFQANKLPKRLFSEALASVFPTIYPVLKEHIPADQEWVRSGEGSYTLGNLFIELYFGEVELRWGRTFKRPLELEDELENLSQAIRKNTLLSGLIPCCETLLQSLSYTDGRWKTKDDAFIFYFERFGGLYVFKLIEGVHGPLHYSLAGEIPKGQAFPESLIFCFNSPDKKLIPSHAYIVDRQTMRPLFYLRSNSDQRGENATQSAYTEEVFKSYLKQKGTSPFKDERSPCFVKTDDKGQLLPIKVLDQTKHHDFIDIPISLFHLDKERLFLFYHEGERRVDSLIIEDLKLSLEYNPKLKKLECSQYPGFFIAENQELPFIKKTSPRALLLANNRGDKRLILLRHEGEVISCSLQGQGLYCEGGKENLFLFSLFAAEGRYSQALRHFVKSQDFELHLEDLISLKEGVKSLSDRSAGALAFYLHFYLEFYERAHQATFSDPVSSPKYLLSISDTKWAYDTYLHYIRALHNTYSNRVPADLRLSLKDEKDLIQLFDEAFISERSSNAYSVRRKLVLSEHKEFSARLNPSLFVISHFAQHYNHISIQKAIPHFIHFLFFGLEEREICQRANLADPTKRDPIDYEILALSQKEDSENINILKLIRYSDNPLSEQDFFDRDHLRKTLESLVSQSKTYPENAITPTHKLKLNYSQPFTVKSTEGPTLALVRWSRFPEDRKQLIRDQVNFPLKDLANQLIQSEEQAQPAIDPSLVQESKEKASLMEQRLNDRMKKSLEVLLSTPHHTHSLKCLPEGQSVISLIESLINQSQQEIDRLKEKVEFFANSSSADRPKKIIQKQLMQSIRYRLRQLGNQQGPLTLDGVLFQALLMKDPMIIRQANPCLTPDELFVLIEDCYAYYTEVLRHQLLCKALSYAQANDIQGLGDCCQWKGDFDPFEHPELLLSSHASGFFPLPDQLSLLKKIFNLEATQKELSHCLFTLRAGGGKSSYISPTLAIVAIRRGLIPVFITPSSLYKVDRIKLQQYLGKWGIRLDVLELSLSRTLEVDEAETFLKVIERSEQKGRALVLTPETYYALKLKYELALETEDTVCIKIFSEALALLKAKGCAIIDESRLTLSPFTSAKISVGASSPLSEKQKEFLLSLYAPLVGLEPIPLNPETDKRWVHEVLCIAQNAQVNVSDSDIRALRLRLADHYSSYASLELSEQQRKEIAAYWKDKNASPPQWMQDLYKIDQEKAERLALTKGFLWSVLDVSLSLKGGMDYGRSSNSPISQPRIRTRETGAYYEDICFSYATSIQSLIQSGLAKEDAQEVIQHLQKLQSYQRFCYNFLEDTPAAQQFQKWTEGSLGKLENVDCGDPILIEDFCTLSKHNLPLLFYALSEHILGKITQPTTYHEVGPVDLFHAFKKSYAFSAWTGLPEGYSMKGGVSREAQTLNSDPFEAQISAKLKEKHNSLVLHFDALDPAGVLEQVSPHLTRLCCILDPRGFFANWSNLEVAKAILEKRLECKGVLFFGDGEHLQLLKRDAQDPERLEGSTIKAALAKKQIQWGVDPFILHCDPERTTGLDIPLPPNEHVLLIEEAGLTKGDAIQAAMRSRGLPFNKNTLVYGVHRKLAAELSTAEQILALQEEKEAAYTSDEVSLVAFQDISFRIKEVVNRQLASQRHCAEGQIALYKKLKGGFQHKKKNTFYTRFAFPQTFGKPGEVLRAFRAQELQRFGVQMDQTLEKETDRVIEEVEKVIHLMPTQPDALGLQKSFMLVQEHNQQQKQDQDLKLERNLSLKKHLHRRHLTEDKSDPLPTNIADKDFTVRLVESSHSVREAFEDDQLFSPLLYFSPQAKYTACSGQKRLGVNYRKSGLFFLLVKETIKEKTSIYSWILSVEEAENFRLALKTADSCKVQRKIALLTDAGKEVQQAQPESSLSFSREEFCELRSSEEFKRLCTEVTLINGKLRSAKQLSKLIQTIEDLGRLQKTWKRVRSGVTDGDPCMLTAIDQLMAIPNAAEKLDK